MNYSQPRTDSAGYWGLGLLIALLIHGVLLWKTAPWFEQSTRDDRPLEVELMDLPPKAKPSPPLVKTLPKPEQPPQPVPQQEKHEDIPQPPDIKPPKLLNDLIQEQESEKLSMKLLQSTQKLQGSTEREQPQQEPPKGIAETNSKPAEKMLQPEEPVPQAKSVNNDIQEPQALPPPENTVKQEQSVAMLSQSHPEPEASIIPQPTAEQPVFEPLPPNYFLNPDFNKPHETPPTPTPKRPTGKSFPNKSTAKKTVNHSPPPPGSPEAKGVGPNTFFTLSNYDWPYESYMGRWAKALIYNWRNNLPMDYMMGKVPGGGEVFVKVSLNRDGSLKNFEVTQVLGASGEMEESVLSAILGASSLPALPDDFEDQELQVHFRFVYPAVRAEPR
ncbi:MAG: TonB C-terminal domain-containing protein [SAR324 cluster bacterium]|nr:TonB C-terminal domain-containing protein [SAR324 cluster bacterium]